jgi:recombination protein RecA
MAISKEALEKVQKIYGKESARLLSDINTDVEFVSTGSLLLDSITGGGLPRGRIIELYGPESVGKSTCAIEAIAEVQRCGLNAYFCDAEHAFDSEYARNLGVNIDELVVTQPDNGEQALDVTIAMIETGEISLAVIDSTSALVPKAEIEGEMSDSQMGLQARMLSKGLRKLAAVANKSNCIVIFISQLRENIGPYGGQKIGVGNALKFYASIRLGMTKSSPIIVDGVAIGHTIVFETKKNKVFPPFRKCEVILRYGEGYDRLSELIDVASEYGVIKKGGSWYSYGDTKLGQGKENVRTLLLDNPELVDEIRQKVMGQAKIS